MNSLLLKSSYRCKNLDYKGVCKKLDRLLTLNNKNNNTEVYEGNKEILTLITASYGFCNRVYKRILENINYYDLTLFDVYDYMGAHKLFDSFESVLAFSVKISLTQAKMPEEVKLNLNKEKYNLYNELFDLLENAYNTDVAENLAYACQIGTVSTIDVAKYLLCKADHRPYMYMSKVAPCLHISHFNKKLTFEDGFNIDLEELL